MYNAFLVITETSNISFFHDFLQWLIFLKSFIFTASD